MTPYPTDASLRSRPTPLRCLADLLSSRPLLPGEDADAYDDLLNRLVAAVSPQDDIEAMWVKDVADREWELRRTQRLRSGLLLLHRRRSLEHLLRQVIPVSDPLYAKITSLAQGCLQNKAKNVESVSRLLSRDGLSLSSILDQAHLDALGELDTLERQMAVLELRRDKLLEQIERRRAKASDRAVTLPHARPRLPDRSTDGEDERLGRMPPNDE